MNEVMQKLNNLPDLLLFIDSTANKSDWEDQDTMLQQRFINELMQEAKSQYTAKKIMKCILQKVTPKSNNATQTRVSDEEEYLRALYEDAKVEITRLKHDLDEFKTKDQAMQVRVVEQEIIIKDLQEKLQGL